MNKPEYSLRLLIANRPLVSLDIRLISVTATATLASTPAAPALLILSIAGPLTRLVPGSLSSSFSSEDAFMGSGDGRGEGAWEF